MGHVFRLDDAERHERWFQSAVGQSVLELEKDALLGVWAPTSCQRVLEVGCGSGIFLEWFASLGHMVTGLDPSSSSLELARRRIGGCVRLDHGFAEDLPYDDNEFDTVAFITSLEFVSDPERALSEAFRVARRNVLIGALNKYSLGRVHYYLETLWKDSLYSRARFFGVFELTDMAETLLAGKVPSAWRTCITFPLPLFRYMRFFERLPLLNRHPFGHFIAMRIDMRSRIQTVQTPIFKKIPSGVANAACRSFCGRSCEEMEKTPARSS